MSKNYKYTYKYNITIRFFKKSLNINLLKKFLNEAIIFYNSNYTKKNPKEIIDYKFYEDFLEIKLLSQKALPNPPRALRRFSQFIKTKIYTMDNIHVNDKNIFCYDYNYELIETSKQDDIISKIKNRLSQVKNSNIYNDDFKNEIINILESLLD